MKRSVQVVQLLPTLFTDSLSGNQGSPYMLGSHWLHGHWSWWGETRRNRFRWFACLLLLLGLRDWYSKLIAGSDGMICSPEDLTPFSTLLLLSLDALPALSGVFLRIEMTSGSAVSTSVWHLYIV